MCTHRAEICAGATGDALKQNRHMSASAGYGGLRTLHTFQNLICINLRRLRLSNA